MNYSLRLSSLRQRLSEKKIGAFLVTSLVNIRYLTGFTGSAGLVVVTGTQAFFFTDSRYDLQAKQEVDSHYKVRIVTGNQWQMVAELLQKAGITAVGFEAEDVTVQQLSGLRQKLRPLKLKALTGAIAEQRLIKDEEELRLLRDAATLTDACYEHLFTWLRPGLTEKVVAREVENYLLDHGADGLSFPVIVAAGENGALPHAQPGDRKIGKGELITIDMGALYRGYCSDCTRVVCLGRATAEQKHYYATLCRAQEAAIAACTVGAAADVPDAVGRAILKEENLEQYFTHALGHGVGLEIHESPTLSQRSQEKLRAGMIVTIEPGIYLPGWGGMRIEDMVLITESGPEILTQASKPATLLSL